MHKQAANKVLYDVPCKKHKQTISSLILTH